MPQVQDYIVDPVLTNLSKAYKNDSLLYSQVFPRMMVKSRTGYYYTFDKARFKIEESRRTGVSRANRVDYGMSKTSYGPLYEHALEQAIEYEVRDTYPSPHDARVDATENVSDRLELGLEKEVADLLTSTGTITQNITLSGTSQFSDFANSDPFSVVQTGIDTVKTGAMVMPNTLIMGYQVFAKLKNHPDLLGRMATSTTRVLTTQMLADLFGVERVLVGGAMHNTAAEGVAASMSYIWGKDMVLCYVAQRPGLKSLSVGYTLQMEGARYVDRWDEQAEKAEFVRANDYYEPKVVAAEAAYLIKAAVA